MKMFLKDKEQIPIRGASRNHHRRRRCRRYRWCTRGTSDRPRSEQSGRLDRQLGTQGTGKSGSGSLE